MLFAVTADAGNSIESKHQNKINSVDRVFTQKWLCQDLSNLLSVPKGEQKDLRNKKNNQIFYKGATDDL